ncbi:ROK family protein [Alteraurantiacibacter palmitatis]|uniref:fructokinase n=1 Tax=Alteraurantiacibacter palmitatis TaxID=2054628 RepID=A0ABV7E4J9_9SPHN
MVESTTQQPRLAGVELGGTKCVVVLGAGHAIVAREQFPTTTPDETLSRAAQILRQWDMAEPLAALGIASFGPVRIDPAATDFGSILTTPKPGWAGAQVLARLQSAIAGPIGLDTDVNAAALAEHAHGAARGCSNVVYLTIGTGLGGGVLTEGRPVHGALHPEIGHIRLRRASGDSFAGICPFHGDCVEGLIAGPALAERLGGRAAELAPSDPAWRFVAHDLAQLIACLMLTFSPHRIVIGGGVALGQPHLIDSARLQVPALLADYLGALDAAKMEDLVRPATLGENAGPIGALVLAAGALARQEEKALD